MRLCWSPRSHDSSPQCQGCSSHTRPLNYSTNHLHSLQGGGKGRHRVRGEEHAVKSTWKEAIFRLWQLPDTLDDFSRWFWQKGIWNQEHLIGNIPKLRIINISPFLIPSVFWTVSGVSVSSVWLLPSGLLNRRRLDPYPSRPPQTAHSRDAWSAAATPVGSPTRLWFWQTGQRGGACLCGKEPLSDSRAPQLDLHASARRRTKKEHRHRRRR